MKVEWVGHIEKGKLDIPNREQFTDALTQLKDGRVVISVSDKGTRSAQANAYLFGVVYRYISDVTGYDVDELHEYFKYKFNRHTAEIDGEMSEYGGTTTKLNVE